MNANSNHLAALRAIGRSCSIDFPTALEWAQWCRSLANAALINDVDAIENLWLNHGQETPTKKET